MREQKRKMKKEKDEFIKKVLSEKAKKEREMKKNPNKTRNEFEYLKCAIVWLNILHHIWQF